MVILLFYHTRLRLTRAAPDIRIGENAERNGENEMELTALRASPAGIVRLL